MLSFPMFLFPSAPDLFIDEVTVEGKEFLVQVRSTKRVIACPLCASSSAKVHGSYTRHPADLPCGPYTVRLQLHVRRFCCQHADCPRKTFAEPFPDVVAAYARRTIRQADLLQELALALGGRAGAPLTQRLRVPVSRHTLLRLLRQRTLPAVPTPRVLGIDEWAWRRRQRYGTILVDLERHCPVDLLPDCTSQRVIAWLKSHPGIKVVSRDRDSAFADAIRKGAPQAVQVADRWHLLQNLHKALKELLSQKRRGSPPVHEEKEVPEASGSEMNALLLGQPRQMAQASQDHLQLPKAHLRQQLNRSKRLARYEEVMALHRQGLSDRAIAKVLQMARGTVLFYVHSDTFPERKVPAKGPSILDPYVPYLLERWEQGEGNGSQLFREVQAQGFPGSKAVVRHFVRELKDEYLAPIRTLRQIKQVAPALVSERLSSQQAAWLFLAPLERLQEEQRCQLERICQADGDLQATYELSQQFASMVTKRKAEQLHAFLQQAKASPFSEMRSFASGIRRDLPAVAEALSSPWSQGQVEGQINRLKMIKRQMYGRASFEVLRLRVLHSTSPELEKGKLEADQGAAKSDTISQEAMAA